MFVEIVKTKPTVKKEVKITIRTNDFIFAVLTIISASIIIGSQLPTINTSEISESQRAIVEGYIQNTPDYLLKGINSITFLNHTLKIEGDNKKYDGMYYSLRKSIALNIESNYLHQTYYHEIGHHIFRQLEKRNVWCKNISYITQYVNDTCETYGNDSWECCSEDFAENFGFYFVDRDRVSIGKQSQLNSYLKQVKD